MQKGPGSRSHGSGWVRGTSELLMVFERNRVVCIHPPIKKRTMKPETATPPHALFIAPDPVHHLKNRNPEPQVQTCNRLSHNPAPLLTTYTGLSEEGCERLCLELLCECQLKSCLQYKPKADRSLKSAIGNRSLQVSLQVALQVALSGRFIHMYKYPHAYVCTYISI